MPGARYLWVKFTGGGSSKTADVFAAVVVVVGDGSGCGCGGGGSLGGLDSGVVVIVVACPNTSVAVCRSSYVLQRRTS